MQQFYIELPYKTQNNIFLNMSYLNITWRKFEEILKELKQLRSSCNNFILNEYTGVLSTDIGKVKFAPGFSSAGRYNAMIKVDAYSLDSLSFLNSLVIDTIIDVN